MLKVLLRWLILLKRLKGNIYFFVIVKGQIRQKLLVLAGLAFCIIKYDIKWICEAGDIRYNRLVSFNNC